jgi:hypothetical protein
MRWKRRIALLLAVLLLLAIVGTGAAAFRSRTRVRELAMFPGNVVAVLPFGDDAVVAADEKGQVRAFALDSGQELWRREVGHPVHDAAARNGLVALLSESGSLSVITSARTLRREELGVPCLRVCLAATGDVDPVAACVFVLADDAKLLLFGASQGGIDRRELHLDYPSDVAAVGSRVFAVDPTIAGLYRVDGETEKVGGPGLEGWGQVLAADQRTVVWWDTDHWLHVLSVESGASRKLGGLKPRPSTLAVDDATGTVLLVTYDGLKWPLGCRVQLLDLETGEPRFERFEPQVGSAALTREAVVLGEKDALVLVPRPIGKLDPNWRAVRPGRE